MFRPRVIPVLLLQNQILVKSIGFKKHQYIGDPLNAVRIFNNFNADELLFLDISATAKGRCIDIGFVREVAEEAKMPFGVGGGFKDVEQVRQAIAAGAEKIVIGAEAVNNPSFVKAASEHFGASTIAVCVDVKKDWRGRTHVWINNGKKNTSLSPEDFAKKMEESGAGEIVLQSIEKDGTMEGYDLDLLRKVSSAITIPVVALGGAGTTDDLSDAFRQGYASAVAAGSLFVFQSKRRGVLINYPEKQIKQTVCTPENLTGNAFAV